MIYTRMLAAALLLIATCAVALSQQAPADIALRTRWRYSMPAATRALPAVNGERVVIGDIEGNVCALGTADGKEAWKVKLPAAVSSPPAFAGSTIVIADEEGTVHALCAADGEATWASKTGGKVVGSPLIVDGRVIVGSYDNSVYCLDLATGQQAWSFATQAQVHAGVVTLPTGLVTGGCDGNLRAIDPASGQQKWALDLEGVIATTPLISDGLAIVGTMEGVVAAVDAEGKLRWKVTPLKDAAAFTAIPAIVGGRVVFVADDGQVASVNAADGTVAATGRIQGRPGGNVAGFGGYALVGTDEGRLEAIDPATGRSVRRVTLGGSVHGVCVAGDTVIATTDDGAVWGLRLPAR